MRRAVRFVAFVSGAVLTARALGLGGEACPSERVARASRRVWRRALFALEAGVRAFREEQARSDGAAPGSRGDGPAA